MSQSLTREELRRMLRRSRPPVAPLTFVEADDPTEPKRLEVLHGTVWNTEEFGAEFQVLFSWLRYCAIRDWRTGGVGTLNSRDWSLR